MNILIAGGSGIIGQELSRCLLQQGHQVRILTRGRGGEANQLPAGAEAVNWDARTPAGWGHRMAEADAVINLAGANIGQRPWTKERKRLIRSSRVEAGEAIVEAIRQASRRPAVVLQIAGAGYYGAQGDQPLDEQCPVGEDFLAGVAVDWEQGTRPVAELGVRHVIMRAGVVLTPQGGILDPFILQNRLFAGGPIGSGRQWISWIHIDDLVRGMIFFLEQENTQGVYNLTSPNPVTNAEFGRTVSKLLGRPFWAPVPALALRALMGEMSTLVLDGQRVLPRRLEEAGFVFEYPDLPSAIANLLEKRKMEVSGSRVQ